jgi:hypothetical protein
MHGKRTRAFRPRLEILEDRCCPSGISIHGHTMLIVGGRLGNTVTVTDDGQGNITGSIDGQTASGVSITHVIVRTGRGDNSVNYHLTNPLTHSERLDFELRGNDTLGLDFSAGVNAPKLDINVLGGKKDQDVTATFGTITATHLNLAANLGGGDDSFLTTLAGDLVEGARVALGANGGAGVDATTVNASGINLDPDARLSVDLVGGAGNDTTNFTYSGQLNGRLTVASAGNTGTDTLTSNITAASGSTGKIDALVKGGHGSDNLTLNVTDNSGSGGASELSALVAVIDAGPGDTVVHTPNVALQSI